MTKQAKNKELPHFHLLIPAAGSACRMALDTPKPYLKIGGKHILRHAIEKFINFNKLESVVTVISEDCHGLYNKAISGLDKCHFTAGSNTRKNSVYNGLKSFSNLKNEDIVLIHDAARPMVQRADIEAILSVMSNKDIPAATLATPVTDSLLKDGNAVERDNMWAIQTPQAFRYGALMAAHQQFEDDDSFTDDAGIMRASGHKVEIVPSSRQNIKITTQDDLKIAKIMMNQNMETRSTMGYDVHAFEQEPSARKLIMGGIEIDHPLALVGHSDADVVLHAITDAILGGLNEGDIGTHFPPSDPQWKDVNSAAFLKVATDMLTAKGGEITFIDVTIMAEEPKIGPHRAAMQARIGEITVMPTSRISIKATTTEKLGFTGRKEGIACQALVTIRLPQSNCL